MATRPEPHFEAKMQQIRFRLGLRPRSRWGSLQRSPDPLAGFKVPTSKEIGKDGKGGEIRKGRDESERRGSPVFNPTFTTGDEAGTIISQRPR